MTKYVIARRPSPWRGQTLLLERGLLAGTRFGEPPQGPYTPLLVPLRQYVREHLHDPVIAIGRAHGTRLTKNGDAVQVSAVVGAALRALLQEDRAVSVLEQRARTRGPFADDIDEFHQEITRRQEQLLLDLVALRDQAGEQT